MKRSSLFLLVLVLLLAPFAGARVQAGLTGRQSAATDRSSTNVSRIRLSGYVPESVRAGQARPAGPSDPTETIVVGLSMQLRDEATLLALVDAVSDPGSPSYGQYLTPTEFAARFGATDAERETVESFLSRAGLREIKAFNNGTLIVAEGSAATVSTAFAVTMSRYVAADGSTFRAPVSEPSLPSDVAGLVAYVSGLDSLPVVRKPHPAVAPATSYTPAQIAMAYDSASLLAAGVNGGGETLASVQFATYSKSDISSFNQTFAVGSHATLVDVPMPQPCGGATSDPNGGDVETTLDLELQMAAAPGATTIYEYNTPPASQSCYDEMVQQIATDNLATTISTSWGICEPLSPNATDADTALHNAFLQMALQGQSFFAASGDNGALDCYLDGNSLYQNANYVDYPASDDHVTGVGGTSLTTASNGDYSSETTWNAGSCNSTYGCESGGGGLSQHWPRPIWQTGPGTSNSYSNGEREVPDVSLDADPNSGYEFVYQGVTQVVGGTSAAAPTWAGFAAIYNQYARSQNRPRLGFANPALYGVANIPSSRALSYHDVTTGTNIVYPATIAYDLATGWGSPDVNQLVHALAAAAPTNTVTPTATITPTGTQTPTVTITPTASDTPPPTNTFSPSPSRTPIPTGPESPTPTPTPSCKPVIVATTAPRTLTPGNFEVFLPNLPNLVTGCGAS